MLTSFGVTERWEMSVGPLNFWDLEISQFYLIVEVDLNRGVISYWYLVMRIDPEIS